MSEVKVNKVSPRTGTDLTLGDSGDTFTVPSGGTLTVASGATLTTTSATVNLPATATVTTELKTNKISPASGTAFTLGDSGDTFTIPSGATIANSGTATGFPSDFAFISTTTISTSVAQVDIDYDYSTYKQIFHFIEGVQADTDGNIYARFKVSGSIDTSSVYSSNTVKKYYNGFDSATYGGNNQTYMYLTNNVGGDTYESWTAQLRILLGSGTGMPMMDLTTFYKTASGNYDANFGAVGIQNFYQIQGIRLFHSAGNLDTGKIHTYGVK